MAKRLRVGILGGGWPGRSHAEALQKRRGVELAALAEPDAERRAWFTERFGELALYDDWQALLRDGGLDAVVNALPTGLHYRSTRAALRAGCHCLCEKPPTTRASEMVKLARLAEETGLVYMFCRQPRYEPARLAARKLVRQGKLGEVYHAEGKWIRCRNIPWGAGGWFVNKKKGGGVLLDLGIHAIDNAWFVMDCPRPVEAFAGLHCAFSHLAPPGVEYTAEDAAVGMVRFENGATLDVMVTFALNTAGPGAEALSGKARPEWGEVRIYGTRGGLDVSAGKWIVGGKQDVTVKALREPAKALPVFEAQAKEFVRAVRAGDEPLNSAAQAVMLMQMLDALRRSGDSGRAVRIKPAV
jgi:predicted dehydrogenase